MDRLKNTGFYMRNANEFDLGRLAVFADSFIDGELHGELVVGTLRARFERGPELRENFVCEPLQQGGEMSIHRFCQVQCRIQLRLPIEPIPEPAGPNAAAQPQLSAEPEQASAREEFECACPVCTMPREILARIKAETTAPESWLCNGSVSDAERREQLLGKTRAMVAKALMAIALGAAAAPRPLQADG